MRIQPGFGSRTSVLVCLVVSLIAQSASAAKYKYDSANRLRSVRRGDTVTSYNYDGWGNLATICSGTVGGTSTCRDVMVDETPTYPRVVGEAMGSVSVLYGYGPQGLVASKGATVEYAMVDRIGTLLGETDTAGNPVARRAYDAWGKVRSEQGTGPNIGFGGEFSSGDGLMWLRARHYLPALGRFLQRDTVTGELTSAQTLNRYTYAGDNPLTRVDPSGHFFVAAAAVVLLAGMFVLASSLEGVNAPMGPGDPSIDEVRSFNQAMPSRVATDAAAALVSGPLVSAVGGWASRSLLTAGLTSASLNGGAILSANGGRILHGAGVAGRSFAGGAATATAPVLGGAASSMNTSTWATSSGGVLRPPGNRMLTRAQAYDCVACSLGAHYDLGPNEMISMQPALKPVPGLGVSRDTLDQVFASSGLQPYKEYMDLPFFGQVVMDRYRSGLLAEGTGFIVSGQGSSGRHVIYMRLQNGQLRALDAQRGIDAATFIDNRAPVWVWELPPSP